MQEAEALFERARALSGDDPLVISDLAYCHVRAGRSDPVRALLRDLEVRSAHAWVSP